MPTVVEEPIRRAGQKRRSRGVRAALVVAHLAGALLLAASPARADSRAELEKARASFLARNWTDAEERLRALLDPNSGTGLRDRGLISQARMYLGALLVGQGKSDEAKEEFTKLVRDDPSFEPDPLSFPGDAINTFIDVKAGLFAELKSQSEKAAQDEADRRKKEAAAKEARRVWLEKLQIQASEERITVRHSRIVACIPFGVGQFQNGQIALGIVFLSAQVAALGGTAVTFGMYNYARGRESDEATGVNGLAPQWHARAEDLRLVNLGFVGGFLLTAAIGIAQANVAFVPETIEKRKREVPPMPATALAPVIAPLSERSSTPNGVFVGIRGVLF